MFPWYLLAQTYYLELSGSEEDLDLVNKFRFERQAPDSALLITQSDGLRTQLQEAGYLDLNLKSDWRDSVHLVTEINLGEQYHWLNLDVSQIDPALLRKVDFNQKLFENRPFQYHEIQLLIDRLIDYAVDTGYPFAAGNLAEVVLKENTVKASLQFELGPLITFDSVKIAEPVKISSRFLQTYLRIQPGTPFSQSLIDEIPSRINRLSYLKLVSDPGLSFQNDQAIAHLSLQQVKANQVDGVLGLLPNAKSDGGLLLTGEFNLLLQNMFGSGRRLSFQWESFKEESQLLDIGFFQPVLFKSPIDLNIQFNLFKEDSTYLNRTFNIDLIYAYGKKHFAGLHTLWRAARLPSTESPEDPAIPVFADFNLSQIGGTYRYESLDDYFNPRSGIRASLMASGGVKKLRNVHDFGDTLLTEIDLESNQFTWEAALEGYLKLSKHWVIAAKWNGGGVYNSRLFLNDLYRLGGLKTIRGFSENTFFAAEYAYSTLEPRFFFETNSYLFAFYDQAWWLRYDLEEQKFKDTPSGFGAGITLSTKAGIFSFIWAVGASKTQDIGVDQSKIHFGYISRF